MNLGGISRFVYSIEELGSLKEKMEEEQKRLHEETLAAIPEEEITPEMREFHLKPLHFFELYEEEALHEIKDRLKEFGFNLNHYLIADGDILKVVEDESSTGLPTLKQLIEFLRQNGRKGIEIQRYKGLGEMNADRFGKRPWIPKKGR